MVNADKGRERGTAFPGQCVPCLASRVSNLDSDSGTLGPNEVSNPFQRRNKVIFPNPQIARCSATARVHLCRFEEDQSSPADREPSEVDQVPIRSESIDTLIHQHGGDDDPITKGQFTYFERRKQ